jgi:hypothetical protein
MSKIALTPNATGTGVFTISSPATNTNRTLTLPDITGTLVSTDASGNVGIGTSSPDALLDVSRSGNGQIAVLQTSANRGFSFESQSDTALQIASVQGSTNLDLWANTLTFSAGATERMRIDSSGNVLVGTTNTDPSFGATAGSSLQPSGQTHHSSTGTSLVLNRTASDGTIAQFRKAGTTVGSIGVASSVPIFNTSTSTGALGVGGTRIYQWDSSQFYPLLDNSKDVGAASYRFDDIYATNGTIQTSDRNEKQDIEALSDAEQRVAVACKGLIRKFRWIDAVAEKGDDARIHFGIIAQDLQDAFAAEGLDAGRYAMFISSTWWEANRVVPAVEAVEGAEATYDDEGNQLTEAVEASRGRI